MNFSGIIDSFSKNPMLMAGGAGLLVILIGVLVLARPQKDAVDARLEKFGTLDSARKDQIDRAANLDATRALAAKLDKAIANRSFAAEAARKLAQADLKMTVAEYVLVKIVSVAVFFGLGVFLGRGAEVFALVIGVIGGVIGLFIPDLYINFLRGKRMRSFNGQLGDTLALMGNSLRSGYSLLQSMELVSREGAPPISDEFRRVVREVGLGLSTQEAMANLLRRMPSEDLDLMVTAINIQYEVGGNMAQILDTIAHTIRERVRIKGEIRALTAQGVASGYIITGLPIALCLFLLLVNPTYMGPMFTWPWVCMPICAGIMIAAGFYTIMKIVNIDV